MYTDVVNCVMEMHRSPCTATASS